MNFALISPENGLRPRLASRYRIMARFRERDALKAMAPTPLLRGRIRPEADFRQGLDHVNAINGYLYEKTNCISCWFFFGFS